jgi:hypothetical protein
MVILSYPTTASPDESDYYTISSSSGGCGICRGTGKALFGVSSDPATAANILAYFVNCDNNYDAYIGIAEENATAADQTVGIRLYGKTSSMSGLTAGSRHYTNPSGKAYVGYTHGAYRVGVAESASEMIIQP